MRQLFELCGKNREICFSPFVWPVRLALRHKGLAFERVPLWFLEKDPYAASGSKTLPTLRDGDTWVSDSLAIARYLEETYPEKPLFGSAAAVAQAGVLQQLTIQHALGPLFPMVAIDVWRALEAENAAYFRKTREERLGGMTLEDAAAGRDEKRAGYQAGLGAFRGALKRQHFLAGDDPAWADYFLFGSFMWAHVISPFNPLEGDDVMTEWFGRMQDLFDGEARHAPRAHG